MPGPKSAIFSNWALSKDRPFIQHSAEGGHGIFPEPWQHRPV